MKTLFSTIVAAICMAIATPTFSQSKKLSRKKAEAYAAQAWQRAASAHMAEHQQMWDERVVRSGTYAMPFDVKVFGDRPSDGRSLYISMHGGGNTTKAVNDQQWRNQQHLYTPSEGVYIAPRAAVDDWNMWFRPHIDTLFAKIIQCAMFQLDVNPNKVYLLGYSAGGDGTYRMAPRMADHWAAASMMAGHPGEASPLNLRNIGFMVWMGEHDSAYNRNTLAVGFGLLMDSLLNADPEGYAHKTTIVGGCGHWMNRADTAAIEWLNDFVRNPYPKRIVWRQEESCLRDCFYNLSVLAEEMGKGKILRVDFEDNTIDIKESDYKAFGIYLNDHIMDLSRPITVKFNGKEIFRGKVARRTEHIDRTIAKRMDPNYIFSALIEVREGAVLTENHLNK